MTKEEAKAEYTAAWMQYTLTSSTSIRQILEDRMDSLQSSIEPGPGPEWAAFADSLPGFRDFWGRFKTEAEKMLKDRFGKNVSVSGSLNKK